MCSLKEYLAVLEEFCPLYLSDEMKKRGMHDNSGIIIDSGKEVRKVLFTLDLSIDAVNRAKRLGVDTIVTHHPAIYNPLYSLSTSEYDSKAVYLAIKYGINVISMHLNLDIAKGGIDDSLALALGAKEMETVFEICDTLGYGKQFLVEETDFDSLVKKVKKTFKTAKIIGYKASREKVKSVASFCGGGASEALSAIKENKLFAGLVVSSDFSHHHVKDLVERGVSVIIIPHYASEEYGFNRFYQEIKNKKIDIQSFYFYDRRFI